VIKGVVIGFILAIAISVGCVFLYFSTGMAPVATADPPMPFEKKFANVALDAHIEKQHIPPSSVPADEPNFLAGASVYKEHCALCHGLPVQPPIDYARVPPDLREGSPRTAVLSSALFRVLREAVRIFL
jgi:mono/diheme cytochrome c family protein